MQGAKKTYRSAQQVFGDVVKIGFIKKRNQALRPQWSGEHTLLARVQTYAEMTRVTVSNSTYDENACKTECTVNISRDTTDIREFLMMVLQNECGGNGNGRNYRLLLYNDQNAVTRITLTEGVWMTNIGEMYSEGEIYTQRGGLRVFVNNLLVNLRQTT